MGKCLAHAGSGNWQGLLRPVPASVDSRSSHRPAAPGTAPLVGVSEDEAFNISQASPLRAQTEGLARVPASGKPPKPGPGLPPNPLPAQPHSQKKQAGRRDQQINPPVTVLPAPGAVSPGCRVAEFLGGRQPASAVTSGWFRVFPGLLCPLPLVILLVRRSPGNQVTTASRNGL